MTTVAEVTANAYLNLDTGLSNSDRVTSNGTVLAGTSAAFTAVSTVSYQYSIDGGTTWSTTFAPVQGENTVIVRIADGNLFSMPSDPFTFTYDTIAPVAPTIAVNGSPATNADTVTYTVTFADVVTGVSLADFSLDAAGTDAGASIASITGDSVNGSAVFTVTVNTGGAGHDGTIGLNFNSANVRDFAGNGGAFLAPASIAADGPSGISIADLNGDGKLDVITGSAGDSSPAMFFSVRPGNGDGTFQANIDFTSSYAGAGATTLADFNKDGKLDIAFTSFNRISVAFGNGDGTFVSPETNYTANTLALTSIATADFNGDGNTDLLATNGNNSSFSVLLGNADGTFQAAQTQTVSGNPAFGFVSPRNAAAGDINGDGIADVVVAGMTPEAAVYLGVNDGTGHGTGAFTAQTPVSEVFRNVLGVKLFDLNGDGKLDLIDASFYEVMVHLGNGDGTFGPQALYSTGGTSHGAMTLGDLNGDGVTDIVVANDGSNNISILYGNANGTFQAASTIPTGTAPSSAAIADVNGDGKADIVVTNTDSIAVLLNGNLTAHAALVTHDNTAPAAPVLALTVDNGSSATDKITSNGTLAPTGVEAGATVEYSIDGGTTWTPSFAAIAGSNTVRARQTDAAGNPGAASADFTFTLDAAPTAVALANTIGHLLETQSTAADIKIGDIQVTDDGVGTNTLGLIGADAARFKIVGTSLYLKAGTVLDYTSKPFYDVAVTADDPLVGAAAPDSTSPTFRLQIDNVNRAPTAILLSAATVLEDAANTSVVGTLSATDPDGAGTFTYTLLNSAGGRFSIVGNQLRVANGLLLDHEQAASHNINVRVTDNTGLVFDKVLKITVGDVATENVLGNAAANTFVGGAGNDILDGGAGIDTLRGQGGNDTYVVDNALDNVVDLVNQGLADHVKTTVSYSLGLGDNIEFLETVTPTLATALMLTGNEIAQTITGNAGANVLNGKAGNDALAGGGGLDVFVFNTALNAATNVDHISDFSSKDDTIKLENSGAGLFTALPLGVLHKDMFFAAAGAVKGHDATDRIVYNTTTGDLYYDADGNGAGAAIKFAVLTTHPAIANADFVVV